jgi:AraC-like DNA-binding protein
MSDALRIRTGEFGRVALLDMDRSLVRHAHPHCHVLLKVDGADTGFLVGDSVAKLTDEQAVLVDAWTPHAYVHVPDAPRTMILALYIEPAWLGLFRDNWVAARRAGFFAHSGGQITPQIRKLAIGLASSMVHSPTAIAEHERLLGDLMIAVIERFTEWRSIGTSLREAAKVQSVDWRVQKAIDLIRASPDQIDTIERLSDAAGMSRANFFRVFEASTGVSPRVFLNVVRLEQAVHVSTNSNMSFGELSDLLGFSSQGHFTRFFRDHTGVAPSQFRSTVRIGDIAEAFRL